ncbi:MAG: hypothetical protein WCA19_11500 [Candidatus Acidiferrales bacterium]
MNFAHLHLLLNHVPVIGSIIALGLFLISFFGKNQDLRRSAYIIFAAVAFLTIPTFLTGFGAQLMIKGPGVSDALLRRHGGSALLSLWFMELTGTFALIGLWESQVTGRPGRWNVLSVLFFALLTVGLMARTGNTGGDIRHPEVRPSTAAVIPGGPVPEGRIGAFIHIFEPDPERFSDVVTASEWWWTFMMAIHYVGLTMIIGTVGLFDIRVMGFLKQLPIAPLHGLLPWGLAGLGINVLTGLLAFSGHPDSYLFSIAFWLKMAALLLLGLNAVVFYLTDIFGRVDSLGAGEDAPISAKLVASSSLFLWLAVIALGRYIQPLADTLHRPN